MGLNHVNFIYATLLFLLNDILSYVKKKNHLTYQQTIKVKRFLLISARKCLKTSHLLDTQSRRLICKLEIRIKTRKKISLDVNKRTLGQYVLFKYLKTQRHHSFFLFCPYPAMPINLILQFFFPDKHFIWYCIYLFLPITNEMIWSAGF